MIKRCLTLMLVGLLIITAVGSVVQAGSVAIATISATFYCDVVLIDYWSDAAATYRVVNVDNGNQAVSNEITFPNTGGQTESIQIPLTQPVPLGTMLKIQFYFGDWFDAYSMETYAIAQGDCSLNPLLPQRYNIGNTGAILALFVAGDVLDFYAVIDSTGVPLFNISAAELAEQYPGIPKVNTLIFQSDDGKFTFYKLTSGEYQINVGPDNDGVTHVFIFTGVPPENIHIHTFTLFDLLSTLPGIRSQIT